MFWKRKPKQKDDESTEAAAEAAADVEEEAEEVDSEDTGQRSAGTGNEEAGEDGNGDAPERESASGEDTSEDDAGDVFADDSEEVGVTGPDGDGITRVRTSGTFEFDGESYEVVANTWIVDADGDGVVVIDPGFDAEAVLEAVGKREIYLVACTNAYAPHIAGAIAVAEEGEADIALHPREMRLWRRYHGAEHRPEIEVEGEGSFQIGDLHIDVLALPGSSPGTVGYYVSALDAVFSGDTLRKGEPGMVGDTYIDYTTQLASIGERLLSLPPTTRILPDRGPATTSGAESKNFDDWV
ncbi:MBL fold metallo-hydrolase [Nocardiopsis sp. CNT312]|uniref:MBL fold metallo-hydrolase n=1 Tax=Nocardiopsis sp. CNT312 TaxID=1137268 RepID=UPI00048CD8E0|nr:MBL fold metallo-hydrolase [Nocardiopsis sp. CNT312]